MSNEYKITTLIDMLDLDDDQIDRICSELPGVLKHIKAFKELINSTAGDGIAMDSVFKVINPLTWIDDGNQDITCNAILNDGEKLSYKIINTSCDKQDDK